MGSKIVARRRRKCAEVQRWIGKTPKGGEYLLIYVYDDDSVRTVEFSRTGAHVAEYDGEPETFDGLELAVEEAGK
jgi:hypothetical protein